MSAYVLHDGPKVPDTFARSLGNFLRTLASLAVKADDRIVTLERKAQARILEELANYVERIDTQDRRMRALLRCQPRFDAPYGTVEGGRVAAPGHRQGRVLALVGHDLNGHQSPEELLAELIDAAIDDRIGELNARHKSDVDRGEQVARAEGIAAGDARAAAAEEREAQAHAARAQAEALAQERGRKLSYHEMGGQPNGNGNGHEPETETERYRRRKFPDDPPGVFRTRLADGSERFEVVIARHKNRTFETREEAIEYARECYGEGEAEDRPRPRSGGTVRELADIWK
jgi:hypothetical protein